MEAARRLPELGDADVVELKEIHVCTPDTYTPAVEGMPRDEGCDGRVSPAGSQEESENTNDYSKDSGISTDSSASVSFSHPPQRPQQPQGEPTPSTSTGITHLIFPSNSLPGNSYPGGESRYHGDLTQGALSGDVRLGDSAPRCQGNGDDRPGDVAETCRIQVNPLCCDGEEEEEEEIQIQRPGIQRVPTQTVRTSERPPAMPHHLIQGATLQRQTLPKTYAKGTLFHVCRCNVNTQEKNDKPQDFNIYLIVAIIASLCFPPFGIASLYYLHKSLKLHRKGEIVKSRQQICYTTRWLYAGFSCACIVILTCVGIIIFINYHDERNTPAPRATQPPSPPVLSGGPGDLKMLENNKVLGGKAQYGANENLVHAHQKASESLSTSPRVATDLAAGPPISSSSSGPPAHNEVRKSEEGGTPELPPPRTPSVPRASPIPPGLRGVLIPPGPPRQGLAGLMPGAAPVRPPVPRGSSPELGSSAAGGRELIRGGDTSLTDLLARVMGH